jgi:hypothetical protein
MSNKLVPSSGGLGGILRVIDSALSQGFDFVTKWGSRAALVLGWDLAAGSGEQYVGIVMCDGMPGVATTNTSADTDLANFPIGTLAMNINTGDWFVKTNATSSYWRTIGVVVSATDPANAYTYLDVGSMLSYNSHCYYKTSVAGTGTEAWVIMSD